MERYTRNYVYVPETGIEVPETYYHGTRQPFSSKGWIFPRSYHNGQGTSAPVNPGQSATLDAAKWVYCTDDPLLAWVYAWHAPGRGKPKVLLIEPFGEFQRDREHSVDSQAWRCESAKVIKIYKVPLMTEEEAFKGWRLTAVSTAGNLELSTRDNLKEEK